MAHFDTHAHDTSHGLRDAALAPIRLVWRLLVDIAEANSRVKQVEALSSLSDAELARRGLKREDIVREVFGGTGGL